MENQVINNKLDALINAVGEIKTSIEVHKVLQLQNEKDITKLKETEAQYKADRYRILGGSGVLAAIISYFVKH